MVYNPKSLKNLVAGGNPSGRPRGMIVWSILKTMKDNTIEELNAIVVDPRATIRMVACANYLLRAGNGDTKVLEFMMEKEDGKAVQTQNTTMSVQGLQQIGQDITPQDTRQVESIVNTITEASSAKSALMAKMNVDIIEKD